MWPTKESNTDIDVGKYDKGTKQLEHDSFKILNRKMWY